MTSIHDQKLDIPYLGGGTAAALFVVTLVAFVAESQLTQVSLPLYLYQQYSNML